ncbi:MAG: Fe-S cluster assembly protein SufD [Bacteroidota bacterium]|nr:Fe-S cluster assembly protein SufD [Bacteroidota bacterium]
MDTTTAISPKDKFIKNLSALPFAEEQVYTANIRKEAQDAYNALDFPTLRNEDWKYTKVTGIIKNEFQSQSTDLKIDIKPFLLEGAEENTLVFVNGYFRKDLSVIASSEKLIVENIADAALKHKELFNTYFARFANFKENIFTALNTAFYTGGTFIHIADKAVIEKPIHILHLNKGDNVISQPRNLFVSGKSSQAKIICTYETLDSNLAFTNVITEVFLKENAHLSIDKLQNENIETSHISTEQVYQEADSNFTINTITMNGALVRNNLNIVVDAENCESNLNGLYLPEGKQHVDNHTLVDHRKPHCQSNELYKGVMNGQSTAVFNGKVFVRQDAQKTNAFQSNKNILLSDDATINSKPELEIYADDVKCSHGSTTGQMDEESVFYLRSRGIGKENAVNLLMNAFVSDVINKIKTESFKQKVEQLLEQKIK